MRTNLHDEPALPAPRTIALPADHPLARRIDGMARAVDQAAKVDRATHQVEAAAQARRDAPAGSVPVHLTPSELVKLHGDLDAGRAAIDAHLVRARAL